MVIISATIFSHTIPIHFQRPKEMRRKKTSIRGYRENEKCMVTLMRIGYWTSGLRGLTDRSDKCDRYLQLEATLKAAR